MEAGLESDLAETHRMLSLTNSAAVRDVLHRLLNDLLTRKQALLAGASSSQAAAQHPPMLMPQSGPPAALQASGSNAALDTSGLANGFGRNVSLGSTGSGSHAQGGGIGAATDSSQLRRTRSLTDTAGDTQSTNSGGAIEPILSSAMVLASPHSSQQLPDKPQHVALGAFDPVWQPSKVGASSEPVQALDGLLTAQHLWQQAEQAGLGNVDGFSAYLGGSAVPKQHGGGGGGGAAANPLHGRSSGMGMPSRQPPPPQHTQHMQHSPLGPTAAAAQWVQQQQQQQHQQHSQQHPQQHQPSGFPTVTAPYSRGMLAGGHQQMTSYGSPKTMLHNLPGNFGASSGNIPQGYHTGRSVVRGGTGGFGGGGVYGGGPAASASFAAAAGGGGLYGGSFPSPYAAGPFPGPVHPSLQYGVDLRGGELDAMGMPLFRPLTTYSWEQSDGLVKIYVPLRGVQTELLRATFTLKSLEVRVVALQGKNYVYAVKSLFMPINVDGCHVAASKTKKNVLITLQKLRSDTREEKYWHDLTAG